MVSSMDRNLALFPHSLAPEPSFAITPNRQTGWSWVIPDLLSA
jgi:hypothetical protein